MTMTTRPLQQQPSGALSPEAQQIAYQAGIAGLAPVVQRLMDAERKIAELEAHVKILVERIPPQLRNAEVRG